MAKITLDAETFKVLASDTRLAILKALDQRPKTVSELGRELDLNKATIHEHLKHLLVGELIQKKDSEGRKWVYYKLAWKGTHLLHPENTTVLVLLSLAALGSAAAAVQLGNWLRWWGQSALNDAAVDDAANGDLAQAAGLAEPGEEDASRMEAYDAEADPEAASDPSADPEAGSDPSADPEASGEPSGEPSGGASEPSEPTTAGSPPPGDPSEPEPSSPTEPSSSPPEEGESTASLANGDGAAEGESTSLQAPFAPDDAAQYGPWWDLFEDPGFWLFAMLALAATALAVAGMVIRARGRRQQ